MNNLKANFRQVLCNGCPIVDNAEVEDIFVEWNFKVKWFPILILNLKYVQPENFGGKALKDAMLELRKWMDGPTRSRSKKEGLVDDDAYAPVVNAKELRN